VTRGEHGASPPSRSVPTFGASSAAVPTDSVPSGSAPSPTTPAPGNGVPLQSFAPTGSADVYAAAAARALWGIDYGLTARTVAGVQTVTYGAGRGRHQTRQIQDAVIAMLCPPTSQPCRVEVFPPRSMPGSGG
ncbi:MAG: hypothetical protein QOE89_4186, partial [Pseudonocardiales bacterium]|nr:hypothetical protein [Pseudonocardiales bacterium]